MMKKNLLVIIGLLVFLLLFLWIMPKEKTSVTEEAKTVESETPTSQRQHPSETGKESKAESSVALKSEEKTIKALSKREQAYFSLGFKAGMEDINFYGKVEDQYGNPVAGARVPFCTGGALLASGKGCGNTKTDASGNFEIHSEGGSLTLNRITHPEITFSYPKPSYGGLQEAVIFEMRFRGYHQSSAENDNLWTDTSPEKPYVFTAWRVEKYEDVKVSNINGYYLSDERLYTLNLEGRSIHEKIVEGVSDGHLRVSCFHPLMQNSRESVNWKVVIAPIDGGIQATDDVYLNLAPEGGYQPSLTVDMQPGASDYTGALINQRYFFTAKNGQVYGSLYVHMEAYGSANECRINIAQYKVNLDGSRNLAVKPRY